MKIVVAVDSFKGSLSSIEAGEAVKEGILKVKPVDVVVKPMADGGEGTAEAFVNGYGGEWISRHVQGPYGHTITARYGYVANRNLAIIEMASASGITLVKKEEMNPLLASSYGFGELIADALDRGCKAFLLGIGGSATNDGGLGMLTALGFEFYGENDTKIGIDGGSLKDLRSLSVKKAHPKLKEATFQVACDVTNPLLGDNGATKVYGPQKGAGPKEQQVLEDGLRHFAKICEETFDQVYKDVPGAGAAGGVGFGLLCFLNATLQPGIQLVMEAVHLEEALKEADLIITGEGKIDVQSAMGKVPEGVLTLGKKHGIPTIALGGMVTKDAQKLNDMGMAGCFAIIHEVLTLEEAMNKDVARENIIHTMQQIFQLVTSVKSMK